MIRFTYLPCLMIALALLVGCAKDPLMLSPEQGSKRPLGDTSLQQAYAAGRMVMGQYFSVDPSRSDPNRGLIVSRPKPVQAGNERLIGGSPARQIGRMVVYQENGIIVAQVNVTQQRQGSAERAAMGYSRERNPTDYSGNPGDVTPANQTAATTSEQNEAWETTRESVPSVEAKILQDLFDHLQGTEPK